MREGLLRRLERRRGAGARRQFKMERQQFALVVDEHGVIAVLGRIPDGPGDRVEVTGVDRRVITAVRIGSAARPPGPSEETALQRI